MFAIDKTVCLYSLIFKKNKETRARDISSKQKKRKVCTNQVWMIGPGCVFKCISTNLFDSFVSSILHNI